MTGVGAIASSYATGGVAFAPTDLAGCILWLDASNAASITQTSGAVSQWSDLSGTNNHGTQATAGNKPTVLTADQNGLDVIKFDGTSDFLAFPGYIINIASVTICCTVKVAAGFGGILTSKASSTDVNPALNIDNTGKLAMGNNGSAAVTSAAVTVWAQITGKLSARVPTIYRNGTPNATGAAGSAYGVGGGHDRMGTYRVGDTNYGELWIGEIAVYNTALSDGDRGTVEAYLKAKWGTP